MFGLLKNFRSIIINGTSPDFSLLLINFVHALIAIGLGAILLKKIGGRASEIL